MNREAFREYMLANNQAGSGKASSYVRALDLLSEMIRSNPADFIDCQDIWSVDSVDRLEALYVFTNEQKHKGAESIWNLEHIPKSYLSKDHCTAALRSYQRYLIEHTYQDALMQAFETNTASEESLVKSLQQDFTVERSLLEAVYPDEGRDVVREVKVRCDQRVFRKMILRIYRNTCCLTGIDLPEVNRASHIIPWAERPETRLDPRNGLCLSATYDAAFDRNLISLDEQYRLLVSKEIRDHYSSEAARTHFLNRSGQPIQLPSKFIPNQSYLETHRNRGRF